MDDLRADCGSCAGLCCVAPAFAASSDFAVDKPAGQPCANLQPDFRCGIHADLRERGFAGCTVFDCFGAGQQVTRVTFGGRDWRSDPAIAQPMFDSFAVMRPLHELLWYLADALGRAEAEPVHADLGRARQRVERLTRSSPDELAALDVNALRGEVNVLLLRTSELVRAPDLAAPRPPRSAPAGCDDTTRAARSVRRRRRTGRRGADLRGADLTGRTLSGADLRGASLRGASLIGADLTGADLRRSDLIGADLRGADLAGADLTGALFLTRFQVDAAHGDPTTRLPSTLDTPPHWRTTLPITPTRRP
ncbi:MULTISPECIES: pentapeptide repeat-containing protein [unclassified Pseudonocardia]|uniref:pentapeptide repeat-containing protein n=1 Tax=unclassified Pseudonocardia TaxID=2619320 RepID=UPI00095A10A3|nr:MULTISPECIES: pentapeptide repeat-containing protein [unclassified Pseudonocardia]MBN9099589.1 pentapeptide repeat-containing protein [Pseudonocardia sp.]OJY43582.1 MAG: hypothetical protein BGP03_25815 [Pseudonocardia sp. 73-21]